MAHDTFLCNQMFPFANVIAFALENNETVFYPSFSKYACHFPYFEKNKACRFPADAYIGPHWRMLGKNRFLERLFLRSNHKLQVIPHILMTPEQRYDFELEPNFQMNEEILSAPGSILDGLYFLSNNNFVRAKSTIKEIFSPSSEILDNVDACINGARENTDILIGTHMRFGDYLTFKKELSYTVEEYYEVMRKFKAMFINHKATFLLCSDEPQDPSKFPEVRAESAPGQAMEDLYCLSKCDLIIGPPSTFSQWASFYGDVPVFNINYKNELIHGLQVSEPNIKDLSVHHAGFGRHSIRKLVELHDFASR